VGADESVRCLTRTDEAERSADVPHALLKSAEERKYNGTSEKSGHMAMGEVEVVVVGMGVSLAR